MRGCWVGHDPNAPLPVFTDCSRTGLGEAQLPASHLNMPHSFGSPGGLALADLLSPSLPSSFQPPATPTPPRPPRGGEHCWPTRPTLRNELDTFSVHFYIFFGPNVSVPPDRPAVFAINLLPVLDSGGILNLELKLNVVRPFGRSGGGLNGGQWLWDTEEAGRPGGGSPLPRCRQERRDGLRD